jgi:hypothetical protein
MPEEPEAVAEVAVPAAGSVVSPIDLDAIEVDLRDVEAALGRLAEGTYFTDSSNLVEQSLEGAE